MTITSKTKLKNYPGYSIFRDGKVTNDKTGRVLKAWKDSCGYLQVGLMINKVRKYKNVHRLLAETFISNPDNLPQVNYKDGIKLNTNLDNLEWTTISGNAKHAFKTGLRKAPPQPKGETHHRAKLLDSDIDEIRNRYSCEKISQEALAKEFNVSQSWICGVVNNTERVAC